jgi:AcrR family transcriptional regulator
MSYRHLDNIDERIIDATIEIGSHNGANRLSTKEIAKACNISEFVIYDHFKSKDNLVSITDHKVFEDASNYAEELIIKDKMKFEQFWNKMVDYYLARPNFTGWTINYGHIFPRPEKSLDTEEFRVDLTNEAKRCMAHTTLKEDWEFCFMWMWIFRNIVCFAQLILSQELDNTEAIRHASCMASYQGLSGFGDFN